MHHDILFQVFLFTVYYCIGHWLFLSDEPKAKTTTSTTTGAAVPKTLAATATPTSTTPSTTTQAAAIATTPATTTTTASTDPQATPCEYLEEHASVKVKATTPAATASTAPKATSNKHLTQNDSVKAAIIAATATPAAQPIQTTLIPTTAAQPSKSRQKGSRKAATKVQPPLQSEDRPPTTLELVPDLIPTAEGEGSGGFGKKTTKGKAKSTTGRTRSRKTIAALSA